MGTRAREPEGQTPTVAVDYTGLNPKQVEAVTLLRGPQRHTCLVGGARSGKTVVFAYTLLTRAAHFPKSRHAALRLHANAIWPSFGMDTLPKVRDIWFPHLRLKQHASYFEIADTGSEIWLGGLDEKDRADRILGNEYATILFEECSQIPYASVRVALSRLAQVVPGLRQRAYYTLNPVGKGHWTNVEFGELLSPVDRKKLPDPDNYKRLFLNPEDNKANLSREYLEDLKNAPTRHRQRFYEGVYQDETENALWSFEGIDALRLDPQYERPPQMQRIVIAVDPSGAKDALDQTHDEIGIIVMGLGVDGHGYVLEDASILASPQVWGRVVLRLFHKWEADRVVAETNFGGAMVEYVIKSQDSNIPYKEVKASRGKAVRAEPVSALAHWDTGLKRGEQKQGRIHHYGRFMKLEEELTSFTDLGYIGERSPNRADAYVWAATELMLSETGQGFIDYMKKMVEKKGRPPMPEDFGPAPALTEGIEAPPEPQPTSMKAPQPWAQFQVGKNHYQANGQSIIDNVLPEDIAAMKKMKCVELQPAEML